MKSLICQIVSRFEGHKHCLHNNYYDYHIERGLMRRVGGGKLGGWGAKNKLKDIGMADNLFVAVS